MQRFIVRSLLGMVLVVAALYAADAIVWHIRNAHLAGMDEVTVSQVTAATLKRNREEYYFDGSITITCTRSMLPQLTSDGWTPPCWYIRRNPVTVTHV